MKDETKKLIDKVQELRSALYSLILSVKAHPDYTGEENDEWTDLIGTAEDAMDNTEEYAE